MGKRIPHEKYKPVSGAPVKSFFVDMLTRDISLSDAILDLIDNCIDGILRQQANRKKSSTKPYEGYHAEISLTKDSFTISDNCGGIPWSLHDYAFRMGRTDPKRDAGLATVGVYGIGMKRAIFKIGKDCVIHTKSGQDAYDVEISSSWLKDEKDWMIPVKEALLPVGEDGTTIKISKLNPGVKASFTEHSASFEKELRDKVATHYAFIIDKGFSVRINDDLVKPRPTGLRLEQGHSKASIRPFVYETTIDGVEIFMAIGFTHPIPSELDIETEQERTQYSSIDAGWTVVCNDRAVLYCDRTELTGWGEAGIPKYHTQFIAISGIVEFRSTDASKLPTTTTKRGIDASSRMYLQVKNKMREGLGMFTDFTNKWKGRELAQEAQDRIRKADPVSFGQLKKLSSEANSPISMRKVRATGGGRQFKPTLPMPSSSTRSNKRITFVRSEEDIRDVADFLLKDSSADASLVGEKCFDIQLNRARR